MNEQSGEMGFRCRILVLFTVQKTKTKKILAYIKVKLKHETPKLLRCVACGMCVRACVCEPAHGALERDTGAGNQRQTKGFIK